MFGKRVFESSREREGIRAKARERLFIEQFYVSNTEYEFRRGC